MLQRLQFGFQLRNLTLQLADHRANGIEQNTTLGLDCARDRSRDVRFPLSRVLPLLTLTHSLFAAIGNANLLMFSLKTIHVLAPPGNNIDLWRRR
jgi:hypothetical protein